MTLMEILLLLLVAAIAGGIGRGLAGYSHGGCLLSIVLGFIGAFIGRWIARELELPSLWSIEIGGNSFPVVWAIIGAALFSMVLNALTRKK